MGEAGARPRKVLFIHQNFPGQFRHLALDLARDPAYQVLALGKQGCPGLPGVRTLLYRLHREAAAQTHQYAKSYEAGVLHGQAVLRQLLALKQQGFVPDVIVAHPGWGETLFVKEVFPAARLVHFCEYYYHTSGADVGFDPEFPSTMDDHARIRARNGLLLLNLEQCDVAIAPTAWQKSLHPPLYHDKIRVIHEGIDTAYMRPDPHATFTLPNGRVLRAGEPVLTYVARNLEPYRGFHVFMRALPAILARHPELQVVIVGGDQVSYGGKPSDAPNWREKMGREVDLDPARVHFTGRIPYPTYRSLLQVSAAHVYLTYPFVLSWSMLEAMACGCALIASRTAPVCEVVRDGENGRLVDFFDGGRLSGMVVDSLANPAAGLALRQRAAAQMQAKYSISSGNASYRALIEEVIVQC